jgi:coenzyme F420-reducing hydrogenase alpha subunit
MVQQMETAEHPEQLERVVIEPLTRVEGHGKVTLLLDEENHIRQARLHIVEFRGFEKFMVSKNSSRGGPTGSCRCWCSVCAASVRSATTWWPPRPPTCWSVPVS